MLTDFACKNAKPKNKTYRLKDHNNLVLEVRTSGKKTWRYRYHLYGKENTLTIGHYPEVSILDARSAMQEARKQVKRNIDPNHGKRQSSFTAEFAHSQTLEVITREWFDTYLDTWSEETAEIIWRRFEIHVFPKVGNHPIHTLTAAGMLAVFRDIEKNSHDVAQRVYKHSVKVFNHAKLTGRISQNPLIELADALKKYKRGHYKAIPIKELPDFLSKLNQHSIRLYRQTALAVRLLMLTAVRTNELIKAKWPEIDFENALWTIPAQRMKMKQEHTVPLSRQALAMFAELKELNGHREWVFPRKGHYKKPMDNATIIRVLERMGYKNKMTGHGFRSVFMGVAKEKLHYPHDVPDRQLAHTPKGSNGAAYDRATYDEARIELMQEYADYLDNPLHYQSHRKVKHDNRPPAPSYAPYQISRSSNHIGFQFKHPQPAHQIGPNSPGQKGHWGTNQILEPRGNFELQERTDH